MQLTRIICAFVFMAGVFVPEVYAAQIAPGNVPEIGGTPTGFATPEAAIQALRARRDVTFKDSGGWLIAEDAANQAVWSFPPRSHPANPSAIKRSVVAGADGKYYIYTAVQCGGTKLVCDQLVLDFQRLNAGIVGH